jgi:hypothetical protein
MSWKETLTFLLHKKLCSISNETSLAFKKIFSDFDIPESSYQLLAGFDEDLIRHRLGYLNQIHIFLRSEPRDMDLFLLRLSPLFEGFTAIIFTNKSTYRHPSAPDEFRKVAYANICYVLSDSQNANTVNIGGSSGQGNDGRDKPDDSGRKGKKRESDGPPIPPNSSKEGNGDPDPESSGPGSGDKSAELSFRVSADLHHGIPFQNLQVLGALKIKV